MSDHTEQDDEPRKPSGCACGGDMPGQCPGRANCPAEQGDDAAIQAQAGDELAGEANE